MYINGSSCATWLHSARPHPWEVAYACPPHYECLILYLLVAAWLVTKQVVCIHPTVHIPRTEYLWISVYIWLYITFLVDIWMSKYICRYVQIQWTIYLSENMSITQISFVYKFMCIWVSISGWLKLSDNISVYNLDTSTTGHIILQN